MRERAVTLERWREHDAAERERFVDALRTPLGSVLAEEMKTRRLAADVLDAIGAQKAGPRQCMTCGSYEGDGEACKAGMRVAHDFEEGSR